MRCFIILALACGLLFAGCAPKSDALYQTSTIGALMAGVYDGQETFGELSAHGDFGLGTFNALDGEMVEIDGEVFQVPLDGQVRRVGPEAQTPFAVTTFFDADAESVPDGPMDCGELKDYIEALLPSRNIFYAIRVDGSFDEVTARSVPRQEKPYPLLVDAVKDQAVFVLDNMEGSLVGFWSPAYVGGVNVPGFHLHFISADRRSGGHVLDCRTEKVKISLDYVRDLYLALPDDQEFSDVDLGGGGEDDLNKVEKQGAKP